MTETEIFLVPHTHWDREWYEPFQRFRIRLVDVLDEVIERAEADPRFHFTLDGQMAAVDDYLEVRGENRERIAALVRRGQLAVGPWQILLDEFLVSGENIVRNLEIGWARAQEIGGGMPVGYLPDEFGHCAQMPQILAGAGFRHACLWRGVPGSVGEHAFRWEAPDGSAVRVEYLIASYGNAASLFTDPTRFEPRTVDLQARMRPLFGDDPVLAMYGTDHSAPVRSLVGMVAGLDDDAPVRVRIGTLGEYIAEVAPEARTEGLTVVRGELRSHARANILPGVLSVRPHLKQAMAAAERMVERYAEPLAALWAPRWPRKFLDMAWWRLVDASGHDSVTGCGVDETAVQVFARISEAEHLGQAVRDQVVHHLARAVPREALIVVNPSPHDRRDLVTADLEIPAEWASVAFEMPDGTRLPTQTESRGGDEPYEETLDSTELESFFRRVHGRELFGSEIVGWRVDPDARELVFELARHRGDEPLEEEALRAAVIDAAEAAPGTWTVRLLARQRRVVTGLVDTAALGWSTVRVVPGEVATDQPVRVRERSIDNGLLHVTVRDDGTLRLEAADGTVLDGVARVVDGGDRGDTYNYAPPGADTMVDAPAEVEISTETAGPLRAVVAVRRTYNWPTAMDWATDRRTPGTKPAEVLVRVELRAGELFVRLGLTVDNRSEDHRVRLHIPVARPTKTSHAEGQFAVVERGMTAEGGCGEHPLPTFPAHGFVDAGGAGVLLTQACEYELLDGELAITVLRSTGQLSRNVHPHRAEPAGPQLATPLAQGIGTTTAALAVLPHAGDWHAGALTAAGERYRHPLYATLGQGASSEAPQTHRGLTVEGASMTSLRLRGDTLELRLLAQSPEPVTAVIQGAFTDADLVDLLGRTRESLTVIDGTLRLSMRAWEIATVQLR
ncbi:MAG: alpha-mannosidase [Actinomycetota bacterium]|nr:alpha-mannosidase [Actinomycetota bacterium]